MFPVGDNLKNLITKKLTLLKNYGKVKLVINNHYLYYSTLQGLKFFRRFEMRKLFVLSMLLFSCFIFTFTSTSTVFASNTASQTITITVEAFAVMGFKDTNNNQAHLVVAEDGTVSSEQKELGLTTTMRDLSISAQITKQPENPSYEIGVMANNANFNGVMGNFLGWMPVSETIPTKLITGIGPGYGFYSIGYKAEKIKEPVGVENYTITFTLTEQ